MSGRLLTFSQYLGGADNVKVIEMFPTTSKTFKYEFSTDVGGWTFDSHYQTLLLDQVSYDRITGEPNFTETNIVGFWNENPNIGGAGSAMVEDQTTGSVFFTIDPERYTGRLFPNARENVVMTVVSFSWTMPNPGNSSGFDTESHRWGIIERYLPGDHIPGDPALDPEFIPYGTGAVLVSGLQLAYSGDPSQEADFIYDTVFTFTDTDQTSPQSNGKGFSIGLSWTEGIQTPSYGILNVGSGYRPGDIINISDEALGNGGNGETTITIGQTS